MGWNDKVAISEILDFCEKERTIQDIMKKFSLSVGECRHATHYLCKAYKDEFKIVKGNGEMRKKYFFKTKRNI